MNIFTLGLWFPGRVGMNESKYTTSNVSLQIVLGMFLPSGCRLAGRDSSHGDDPVLTPLPAEHVLGRAAMGAVYIHHGPHGIPPQVRVLAGPSAGYLRTCCSVCGSADVSGIEYQYIVKII